MVDSDVPSSLMAMAVEARPSRIVMVDVLKSLPELRADEHYRDAWVVFTKAGIPRSVATLDLTVDVTSIERRMHELVGQTVASEDIEETPLTDAELPRVTVVVPSIVVRVEDLGNCLDAIEQLDYPNFEVVLVDNRRELPARDPLPSLVAGRPRLRVVRESRPGVSAARNAGVASANGDVVAFTDDDVCVDRRWLRVIGSRMVRDPRVDVVTGLILPTELETPAQIWFERYFGGFSGQRSFAPVTLEAAPSGWPLRGSRVFVRDVNGKLLRRISILGVGGYGAGANMAFRKTALERIGGFDDFLGAGTPARGGEDLAAIIGVLWSGGLVAYESAAFVHHRHRQGYQELLAQMKGCGCGFTAMMTSLVRNEPRRAFSVLSQLPEVSMWKIAQCVERVRGRREDLNTSKQVHPLYPFALFTCELRSFFDGPPAYVRSRSLLSVAPSLRREREI